MSPRCRVLYSNVLFGIIVVYGLATRASSQLVGCDVLGCESAGCTVGNTTNAFLGATSFNTTVSPRGTLTWTVGALAEEFSANSTDTRFTKNFYLGYPPSLNLQDPSTFSGCALFFEGIARSIQLNGTSEFGPVTCGQTLGDDCVTDLLAQARQVLQTLRSAADATSTSVCSDLQSILEREPPQSCQPISQITWGSVIAKELTGSKAPVSPIPQQSCHPSVAGASYDVALIETQTVTSEEVSSDPAPFFYSITPVLTLFYSPVGSNAQTSSLGLSLPQTYLSCLKVVEYSTVVDSPQTNAAVDMRMPNLSWASTIVILVLSFLTAL